MTVDDLTKSADILWSRSVGPSHEASAVRSPITRGDGSARITEAVVEIDDPELPHRVLLRMRARGSRAWQLAAVEIGSQNHDQDLGPDVLASIPLADYVALAVQRLAAEDREARSNAAKDQARPGHRVTEHRPERRTPQTFDKAALRAAAEIYREALASPVPRERLAPTAAVARAFGLDRTNAGRVVARARLAGLLNPALPRRPGEMPHEWQGGCR